MRGELALVAAEEGSVCRVPSSPRLRFQLAPQVRGSSVTDHCPAATAWPIREYQRDHRRHSL